MIVVIAPLMIVVSAPDGERNKHPLNLREMGIRTARVQEKARRTCATVTIRSVLVQPRRGERPQPALGQSYPQAAVLGLRGHTLLPPSPLPFFQQLISS